MRSKKRKFIATQILDPMSYKFPSFQEATPDLAAMIQLQKRAPNLKYEFNEMK